jgi:uncharacterized RDD family membrane protein YckC
MPSSQVVPATSRPERVLYVRAAGFPRRALAALVDTLLVLAIAIGVTAVAALALGVPLPRPRELGPDLLLAGVLDRNPMAVGAAGLFLGISALYHFYLGGITGQTLGKRLFRLRVISTRGTTPGPVRGIFRFFVMLLSVLPAGLGWLWCLFDREHRSLHDHLAGTHVIVDES